ncbi:hypothetical protein D3C75_695960 [compost metagenome]
MRLLAFQCEPPFPLLLKSGIFPQQKGEPSVHNIRIEHLGEAKLYEVLGILLFLSRNGAVEEHRDALGLTLRTGHPAWLRDQQIRCIHQLIDFAAVSQDLHVGMIQQRSGTHFGHKLIVAAHAEDQLDVIHSGGQRIHDIFAEHQTPSTAHNEYGRDIGKPELLTELRLVGTLPEFRMHRNAGDRHHFRRNTSSGQNRFDPRR